MISYDEIIQYSNIDIAVCDIIEKNNEVFMPFFENFYPFVKENFLKNYDKLLEFTKTKNNEMNSTSKEFRTGFYGMRINVDYNKVIERLKCSKEFASVM